MAAASAEGFPIEGYACLFGVTDLGRDLVLPGAFAESIARQGPGGVRLLYQHDPAEPIGVWTEMFEDARGLYVRGALSSDVMRARECAALVRDGALDGLSIGFKTVEARTDPRARVRRIARVDLWEVSIVTFPMQPQARIARPPVPAGLSDDLRIARVPAAAGISEGLRSARLPAPTGTPEGRRIARTTAKANASGNLRGTSMPVQAGGSGVARKVRAAPDAAARLMSAAARLSAALAG